MLAFISVAFIAEIQSKTCARSGDQDDGKYSVFIASVSIATLQTFEEAAERVKQLKTSPNNDELLALYGLYKQATDGDNKTQNPAFSIKSESAALQRVFEIHRRLQRPRQIEHVGREKGHKRR